MWVVFSKKPTLSVTDLYPCKTKLLFENELYAVFLKQIATRDLTMDAYITYEFLNKKPEKNIFDKQTHTKREKKCCFLRGFAFINNKKVSISSYRFCPSIQVQKTSYDDVSFVFLPDPLSIDDFFDKEDTV